MGDNTESKAISHEKAREPFFHITRKGNTKFAKRLLIRLSAIALALVLCIILTMLLTGDSFGNILNVMLDGVFGTKNRRWSVIQNASILLCLGLAVTPAFMMRFWNIGAEGQALMGGLAAAMCMMFLGNNVPPAVLIICMVVSSIVIGALWALIPAFFKAHWNTNETLFTLMMNYIATQIVSYFVVHNSTSVGAATISAINADTRAGWFPAIFGEKYLCNVLIVVAITIILYIYLAKSKHGFEISVVGQSENTAKYLGINVKKVILRTMLISGAICGIAGLLLVGGTNHTIATNTVNGRGFTAIMVSWLGKFNPIFMILYSFLIVIIEKASTELSTIYPMLNDSYAEILTGIIIFFIIGNDFFLNYSIKKNKNRSKKEVA